MTIALIRHAETDMAGRFCGHSDPVLNAAGERQVICIAEEVSQLGIERIYSSDLRRASQTAAAIAQRSGIAVNYLAGLREIHFGQWEGLAWEEVVIRSPEAADRWLKEFPFRSATGGEDYMSFTERVDAAITTVLRETTGRKAAIVTHRGVMRYALTKFFSFAESDAWASTAHYGSTVVTTNPFYACEVQS